MRQTTSINSLSITKYYTPGDTQAILPPSSRLALPRAIAQMPDAPLQVRLPIPETVTRSSSTLNLGPTNTLAEALAQTPNMLSSSPPPPPSQRWLCAPRSSLWLTLCCPENALDFVSIGSPCRHLVSCDNGVEDPLKRFQLSLTSFPQDFFSLLRCHPFFALRHTILLRYTQVLHFI